MKTLFALLLWFAIQSPVYATFSVIACESETGVCGAAVTTNNLAVGASVLHVEANVGALVSQFETHPKHGPVGLDYLTRQISPKKVMEQLLQKDNHFDGGSTADRQIAIIDTQNRIASWSGSNVLASGWAGQMQSKDASFQGNGLQTETVLTAMQSQWHKSFGSLASRLLNSLEAGQSAGGQANGQMSAALLVKTPQGFPFDIDLRVDAHPQPVKQLRYLLELHQARQLMIDARRLANTEPQKARQLMIEALQKGKSWDRVLKRGITVAKALNDKKLQTQLEQQLNTLNPNMPTPQ